MDAVRRSEEARGCKVVDVSAETRGWDLPSYPPTTDGKAYRGVFRYERRVQISLAASTRA